MLDTHISAPACERRGLSRRYCGDRGTLAAWASLGRDQWQAAVCNISAGGIGMWFEREVEPGALVAVELLNNGRQFWHLKLLRVVHATPRGRGWLVGSSFLKRFSDAEFTALFE